MWLAEQGHDVTGVELSAIAVEEFFTEHGLAYERETSGALSCYRAVEKPIAFYCGDYFDFEAPRFDALFDRASLIALDVRLRPDYAEHTRTLPKTEAAQLLITLEYDQSLVNGPPYCVMADEVLSYWPQLGPVHEEEALASCPPKFREAGVTHVNEVTWIR